MLVEMSRVGNTAAIATYFTDPPLCDPVPAYLNDRLRSAPDGAEARRCCHVHFRAVAFCASCCDCNPALCLARSPPGARCHDLLAYYNKNPFLPGYDTHFTATSRCGVILPHDRIESTMSPLSKICSFPASGPLRTGNGPGEPGSC